MIGRIFQPEQPHGADRAMRSCLDALGQLSRAASLPSENGPTMLAGDSHLASQDRDGFDEGRKGHTTRVREILTESSQTRLLYFGKEKAILFRQRGSWVPATSPALPRFAGVFCLPKKI